MDTEIYYFSGTGNSLAVAREIAKDTGAKLFSIPNAMRAEHITPGARRIGIVFPAYLSGVCGVPLLVERFVRKIDGINNLRLFAVCTCGGYESVNALPALHRLDKTVRECGGKIKAWYSVRLPMNNLDYAHIPVPIEKDSGVIISRSKMKIARICGGISKNRGDALRFAKVLFVFLMKPMFGLMEKPVTASLREKAKEPADSRLGWRELVPLTDRSITVSEACTGCGTCARVCPAGNILMEGGRPLMQHRCEMCFACDEWCPAGAIRHWSRAAGVKYRHPDVKAGDMVRGNREEDA